MIVLDLACAHDHRFEGWFASSAAFEEQLANDLVTCPVCGDKHVRKLVCAPYVQSSSLKSPPEQALAASSAPQMSQLIQNLRDKIQQAENVGENFSVEVRRIHSGDAQQRTITGVASVADVVDLLEEGINIIPLPPDNKDLH